MPDLIDKPKQGLYKTTCPHCGALLMSGRSLAMRMGHNVGFGVCLKCGEVFVQRLLGDSQAMESCKLDSPLNEKWHDEAYASKPASTHLEVVS